MTNGMHFTNLRYVRFFNRTYLNREFGNSFYIKETSKLHTISITPYLRYNLLFRSQKKENQAKYYAKNVTMQITIYIRENRTFDFCKLFFFTLGGAASSPSRLVEGLLEILRGAVGVPSSMGDVIELRE